MDTALYFSRNAVYSKEGTTISLVDIFNDENPAIALESWFGNIFQLADGQHTVEELYVLVKNSFDGKPPSQLKKTILDVVQRLNDEGLVLLSEMPRELPYYLSGPVEQLDMEKAKQLLIEDRKASQNP